jgi:DNA-binding LytR/AlgR family response regulator
VQISPETIVLEGTTKETVTVNPNDILYIESSGNYVSIVYRDVDTNRNKLLRSTIKHIEDMLLPYAVFVRCHRAYIVNINQISTIAAHEQGFRLNLFDTLEIIPVSHAYLGDLKDAFRYDF